jgi:hypothetical protein
VPRELKLRLVLVTVANHPNHVFVVFEKFSFAGFRIVRARFGPSDPRDLRLLRTSNDVPMQSGQTQSVRGERSRPQNSIGFEVYILHSPLPFFD